MGKGISKRIAAAPHVARLGRRDDKSAAIQNRPAHDLPGCSIRTLIITADEAYEVTSVVTADLPGHLVAEHRHNKDDDSRAEHAIGHLAGGWGGREEYDECRNPEKNKKGHFEETDHILIRKGIHKFCQKLKHLAQRDLSLQALPRQRSPALNHRHLVCCGTAE